MKTRVYTKILLKGFFLCLFMMGGIEDARANKFWGFIVNNGKKKVPAEAPARNLPWSEIKKVVNNAKWRTGITTAGEGAALRPLLQNREILKGMYEYEKIFHTILPEQEQTQAKASSFYESAVRLPISSLVLKKGMLLDGLSLTEKPYRAYTMATITADLYMSNRQLLDMGKGLSSPEVQGVLRLKEQMEKAFLEFYEKNPINPMVFNFYLTEILKANSERSVSDRILIHRICMEKAAPLFVDGITYQEFLALYDILAVAQHLPLEPVTPYLFEETANELWDLMFGVYIETGNTEFIPPVREQIGDWVEAVEKVSSSLK